MKFSVGVSLLAGALALTLGLKVVASVPKAGSDEALWGEKVKDLLGRQGFDGDAQLNRLGLAIFARRGECRMVVREYPAHGAYAAAFNDLARAYGPLQYVYRGTVGVEPPAKLRLLTEYFVGNELANIGISIPRAPVLAVAASASCDPSAIDWSGIATVARQRGADPTMAPSGRHSSTDRTGTS